MKKNPWIVGIWVFIALFVFDAQWTVYGMEAPENRPEPSRLFAIPKGEVLDAFVVNLCAGRGFGVEGGGSFWGLSAGLGGVGEIEISTTKTVNRLTEETQAFPISAFKVQLLSEKSSQPSISVALRACDWNSWFADRSRFTVAASSLTIDGEPLQTVDFDSRFTILYVAASKTFGPWQFHGGLSLTDVRTREGRVYTRMGRKELQDLKENVVSGFAGIEYQKNAHTKLLVDLQSVPEYNLDQHSEELTVSRLWLGIGGIRFFLTPWLAIDGGVAYQSNYSGIGDAEITLGANVTFDVVRRFSKKARNSEQ